MRVLIIISLFCCFFIPASSQIELLTNQANISVENRSDKISILLIVQEQTGKKDREYIDALLAYYNLDYNNIKLSVLRLKDGTCAQNDTIIDFGDIKISRKQLNNFTPYKLFIPITKSKKQKVNEFLYQKLGSHVFEVLFSERSKK